MSNWLIVKWLCSVLNYWWVIQHTAGFIEYHNTVSKSAQTGYLQRLWLGSVCIFWSSSFSQEAQGNNNDTRTAGITVNTFFILFILRSPLIFFRIRSRDWQIGIIMIDYYFINQVYSPECQVYKFVWDANTINHPIYNNTRERSPPKKK